VERIVVRAAGGTITMDAINWCSQMGIALSFVDSDSKLLNCMVPDMPHDGPVKRAQAVSAVTDHAVDLARYLLGKKIDSQIYALEQDFPRLNIGKVSGKSPGSRLLHACKERLLKTTRLADFLAVEGRAAQIYWDQLVEFPLPWKPWALSRIPTHWAAISARTTGRLWPPTRSATDPFNAVLNYCYTLLEVETRIACEATGLDPDLGLVHVDARLRESFIYDLLEPLRAKADVWALEVLRKETMRPEMFHELRDGVVRLDPDLCGLLAKALMPRFRTAAGDLANDYAKQLRRIAVPTRLGIAERKPIEQRRGTWEHSNCGYCKEPLPRKRPKILRTAVLSAIQRRGGKTDREGAAEVGGVAATGNQSRSRRRGGEKTRRGNSKKQSARDYWQAT
jgi:CRISPR-associated protein Cas1